MTTSTTITNNNKKRKSEPATDSNAATKPAHKKKSNDTPSSLHSSNDAPADTSSTQSSPPPFEPYTLSQIRDKINSISKRIPQVPPDGLDPTNKAAVKSWAVQMHAIIEEFNLLICCVSSATYKWGTDRSGAADQNLVLLSNELNNAQDQISTSVSPKLSNVLAPTVDLVTKESVTTKEEGKGGLMVEKKVNYFAQEESDPAFIQLCIDILCRNAVMLRHVLLTNFHKVGRCIDDYLKATSKDGEGRGNLHYSF